MLKNRKNSCSVRRRWLLLLWLCVTGLVPVRHRRRRRSCLWLWCGNGRGPAVNHCRFDSFPLLEFFIGDGRRLNCGFFGCRLLLLRICHSGGRRSRIDGHVTVITAVTRPAVTSSLAVTAVTRRRQNPLAFLF